ncbi:AraC family transcriptional regulator [Bermanella marisrubri]|uniref:AraC-type DNA-binding domain-containing protein n=1 Tax=Bermanella marisrubri TaxID=207949 RepID=Q1N693_9GAMM|nr:AraC family transcriptional regulator [Bermanella marisrubri]EAT13699.1 AraC-type DNA-binding domain-containing protein [Oceanobacter sp. RED65] [Bermanella marisrubri]QIZ84477.1 AraC family transcriptional regulator [Bermanella marisrubri]
MESAIMSSQPEPTIGIASARALIEYYQNFDWSPSDIARHLGCDIALLTEEEQRLPYNLYERIWQLAKELSHDEALGLTIASKDTFADLGLVAHVVYNSPTLREGLQHYQRLFSVVNEAIKLEFTEENNEGILVFKYFNAEQYNQSDMERTLGIVVKRTQTAIGPMAKFTCAKFAHSKPDYAAAYEELFPCKVSFESEFCELRFDAQMLNLKPKRRNPHIGRATLNYANQILSRLFKRSISDKVRRLVEVNIADSEFDAEQVAKALNMSRQTLYRKLKNDNSSYSDIVEAVKKEKAFKLLKTTSTPLTVIAYDLGFSELSAFTRAFKRWTGLSPAEFRRQNQL